MAQVLMEKQVSGVPTATNRGIVPAAAVVTVLVGAGPTRPGQVAFKALQTYSNGDVVRWIDVQQPGQPEPDHPAPVLTLTAAAPDGGSANCTSRAISCAPGSIVGGMGESGLSGCCGWSFNVVIAPAAILNAGVLVRIRQLLQLPERDAN